MERGLSDELLACSYLRFKAENILPLLFHECPLTLTQYLEVFSRPETNTLGAFIVPENGGSLELAGLMWFSGTCKMGQNHTRADVGESFFRGFSQPETLVRFAQLGIQWAFEKLGISTITGATPAPNRAGVLFARKLDFQVVGPLEGRAVWAGDLCSVYLSSMTKTRWSKISPWGMEG